MRASPVPDVIELDGDRFADLAMAQDAALAAVARALAAVVREGITGQDLAVIDGLITFNTDSDNEQRLSS